MILFLLGCSLLGIYFPPEWSHSDVRKTLNGKYCVTGAAKVRKNVRFAEETAQHRANVKLLAEYTEIMYPFSEYLDEHTGIPLRIIQTEAIHGVDKGPIRTERERIEYIPNQIQAKRVWSMHCFSEDETLLNQFANAWLDVYESQEKKEESIDETSLDNEITDVPSEEGEAEPSLKEMVLQLLQSYKDKE